MAFSFQTRAKLCYEERISVREVFDFKTGETLENVSSANSIPPEFLLPPFLAASGHFLGQSVVCPWGTWKQPAIIYSTTVGLQEQTNPPQWKSIKNQSMKLNQHKDYLSRIPE